jgi:hypothetical protein
MFLYVNFLYSVYPCPIETSRGSILWLWFSYYVLSFVLLRQKGGVYVSFWTGNVFLTGQVIFVSEWPKGEFVSFCIGCILLTKSLLCNVAVFTGMPYHFRIFKLLEFISLKMQRALL